MIVLIRDTLHHTTNKGSTMLKESIEIVLDDKLYVVIGKAFPVISQRKARADESYLEEELELGNVVRVSGHLAAARCGDGTIDIYEF